MAQDRIQTLRELSWAAEDLYINGQLAEAEQTARRALDGQKDLLHPWHADTLYTTGTLAIVLAKRGRYDEVATKLREVFETRGREIFPGAEDPTTLRAAHDLALRLHKQGESRLARWPFQQALKGYIVRYGEGDDSTIGIMSNLHRTLRAQCELDDAEDFFRRTWELSARVPAATHPGVVDIIYFLAKVLCRMQYGDEGESLFRVAIEQQLAVGLSDGRDILQRMSDFTILMLQHGRSAAAVDMALRAVAVREKSGHVRDMTDPDTHLLFNNIAAALVSSRHYDMAERQLRQSLEGLTVGLGRDHPDTLSILHNLAGVLEARYKYAEAEELNRQAIAGRIAVLGAEHPKTLDSTGQLVGVLIRMKKYGEAEELNVALVDVKRKVMGDDDLSTLESAFTLGCLYEKQGKRRLARDTFYEAQCKALKVGPPDHPVVTKLESACSQLTGVGEEEG